MLLDVDNAIPYLLERGHLSPRDVVEGTVRVTNVSRRNRNLRITRRGELGLLLKQAEAAGSTATLDNETSFYRMCHQDARGEPVRPLIPKLHGVEEADQVLLIELVEDARPLTLWRHRFDSAAFLTKVGGEIGRVLGVYHQAFRSLIGTPSRHSARLGRNAPWVLWVHRPGPEILAELSAANMKTLRILQQKVELSQRLDQLRKGWRTQSLVHCDIKADNLLVRGDPDGDIGITLVDWELAQLGDPAWDVGAMFKDFVADWIVSMPISKRRSSREMMEAAVHPLAGFQAGLRALWRSYQAAAELGSEANEFLVRASGYAGAWLVQSAYEAAQRAADLGNHEIMMLQVAANVLANPTEAALQLFGIPMRGGLA